MVHQSHISHAVLIVVGCLEYRSIIALGDLLYFATRKMGESPRGKKKTALLSSST
jgi:hypothetical protein